MPWSYGSRIFTTTYAISAYRHWCCEFESRSGRGVQHYVIKFVSDLRQVGGFLRVLRFPPPIQPPRYNWNVVASDVKHHQTNKQTNRPNWRVMPLLLLLSDWRKCDRIVKMTYTIRQLCLTAILLIIYPVFVRNEANNLVSITIWLFNYFFSSETLNHYYI